MEFLIAWRTSYMDQAMHAGVIMTPFYSSPTSLPLLGWQAATCYHRMPLDHTWAALNMCPPHRKKTRRCITVCVCDTLITRDCSKQNHGIINLSQLRSDRLTWAMWLPWWQILLSNQIIIVGHICVVFTTVNRLRVQSLRLTRWRGYGETINDQAD